MAMSGRRIILFNGKHFFYGKWQWRGGGIFLKDEKSVNIVANKQERDSVRAREREREIYSR